MKKSIDQIKEEIAVLIKEGKEIEDKYGSTILKDLSIKEVLAQISNNKTMVTNIITIKDHLKDSFKQLIEDYAISIENETISINDIKQDIFVINKQLVIANNMIDILIDADYYDLAVQILDPILLLVNELKNIIMDKFSIERGNEDDLVGLIKINISELNKDIIALKSTGSELLQAISTIKYDNLLPYQEVSLMGSIDNILSEFDHLQTSYRYNFNSRTNMTEIIENDIKIIEDININYKKISRQYHRLGTEYNKIHEMYQAVVALNVIGIKKLQWFFN